MKALKPFLPRLRRVGHEAGALSPWLHPELTARGRFTAAKKFVVLRRPVKSRSAAMTVFLRYRNCLYAPGNSVNSRSRIRKLLRDKCCHSPSVELVIRGVRCHAAAFVRARLRKRRSAGLSFSASQMAL